MSSIDGVAYALERSSLTRAALADVQVGDSVTIAIRPHRSAATEATVRVVEHVAHSRD